MPFSERDFKRFGIELLSKNGFEVEIWDISYITNPASYAPSSLSDWSKYIVFKDVDNLLCELKKLPQSTFVIIFNINYSLKTIGIYRAISASKARYAISLANALPKPATKRAFLPYLKAPPSLLLKKIINQMFIRLPPALFGIKPASLILAGGELSIRDKNSYPTNRTSEILWAHTLDYDLYLAEKNVPYVERSLAVFLDEFLPFHSDISRLEIPFYIDANKYYQLLNKFFDKLEKELKLKVVIAAHPRSTYEKLPDYFKGRECIKGRTIKLVKESQLVLAHSSTSLNFANLFYKPVIFLSSFDLDRSYMGPLIRTMANWFGKNVVFMDADGKVDWNQELAVSREHYNRYRRAYIKSEHSEELPFWQIVANRLKMAWPDVMTFK